MNIPDHMLSADSEYTGEGFTYEHSPAKTDTIKVDREILRKFNAPQHIIDKGEVVITFHGKNGRKVEQRNNEM
jgi:hypothetical protein